MGVYDSRQLLGPNMMVTPEGGVAIRVLNKTGGPCVKGYALQPSDTTDNAVRHITVDVPAPILITYSHGVPDGQYIWAVCAGKAHVYVANAVTRGQLVRGYLTSDGGTPVAGQTLSESVPSAPFATDKHFYEIAHAMESTGGAGLCLCEVTHKN